MFSVRNNVQTKFRAPLHLVKKHHVKKRDYRADRLLDLRDETVVRQKRFFRKWPKKESTRLSFQFAILNFQAGSDCEDLETRRPSIFDFGENAGFQHFRQSPKVQGLRTPRHSQTDIEMLV